MLHNLIREIYKTAIECMGNAFLLTFFFMFFYMSVKEKGIKGSLRSWKQQFVEKSSFRKVFFLMLYTFLVLVKTVLARSIWYDPYSKFFTDWSLIDEYGHISLAMVENIVLFIPFTFLFLWNMDDKEKKKSWMRKMFLGIGAGFFLSLGIESAQLIFRLGTFQFSDIFYNAVGGIIGTLIYGMISKVHIITKE